MLKEHDSLLKQGQFSYAFWGRRNVAGIESGLNFGSILNFVLDVVETFLDGKAGFHSCNQTKKLIKLLDEISPDVVHLHNLHGYYVNVELLFTWLASRDCYVEWTLHDCWAFTGHCAYFTYAKCSQWTSRCASDAVCSQLRSYPPTFASDKSCAWCFERKKELFKLIPRDRMKIIVPSQWLGDLVSRSFLGDYPIEVRHNEIDERIFEPTPSNFRERYGIGNRFMILGVASPWSRRKGLDDFIKLAHDLDSDRYAVVLVGLSKKQIKTLHQQLIALPKTDSPLQLAEIYSAADVFFNPTVEDNYPTVNLEAEACGTPVVTYDTGGCAETIHMNESRVVDSYATALAEMVNRGRY